MFKLVRLTKLPLSLFQASDERDSSNVRDETSRSLVESIADDDDDEYQDNLMGEDKVTEAGKDNVSEVTYILFGVIEHTHTLSF